MPTNPRQRLRRFYDQALLSPDLLCLNCARWAWNSPEDPCPAGRRQDCQLFVNDMVNRLAASAPPPASPRPQQAPTRP
ncbi:MAG: hypothetical protein LDL07_09065 [Desulfarculus sp.]|nr:hypothetical protein [Desulfarculus sp.]